MERVGPIALGCRLFRAAVNAHQWLVAGQPHTAYSRTDSRAKSSLQMIRSLKLLCLCVLSAQACLRLTKLQRDELAMLYETHLQDQAASQQDCLTVALKLQVRHPVFSGWLPLVKNKPTW